MNRILALFVFATAILASTVVKAQQLTPPQQTELNRLFKTKKVVYFKFKVRSLQEIPAFGKMVSVDKSVGNEVSAHATKAQFTQFMKCNLKYTVTSGGGTTKKKATTTKTTKPATKKK